MKASPIRAKVSCNFPFLAAHEQKRTNCSWYKAAVCRFTWDCSRNVVPLRAASASASWWVRSRLGAWVSFFERRCRFERGEGKLELSGRDILEGCRAPTPNFNTVSDADEERAGAGNQKEELLLLLLPVGAPARQQRAVP